KLSFNLYLPLALKSSNKSLLKSIIGVFKIVLISIFSCSTLILLTNICVRSSSVVSLLLFVYFIFSFCLSVIFFFFSFFFFFFFQLHKHLLSFLLRSFFLG